jgi:hypothetical protein
MPSQNEQSSHEHNSAKIYVSTSSVGTQILNANGEKRNSNGEQNERPEKLSIWRDVKWTDIGQFILNAILATFTALLFYQTKTSTNAAVEAASEAKRANDHTIYKDSIGHIEDSSTAIIQRIKDSLTIDIAQRSLQTQIGTTEEAQKQFILINRPLLQVANLRFSDISDDKILTFEWDIENLGSQPAILLTKATRTAILSAPPESLLSNILPSPEKFKTDTLNYYVKNRPVNMVFLGNHPWGEFISGIRNGSLFLYFFVKLTYQNIITGEISEYRFCLYPDLAKMDPDKKSFQMRVIQNKTTLIRKGIK